MLATWVPAKAKNRNRKVPTNSPAMAMKWLRGTLGSRLKKGAGRGTGLFSDSAVVCEIPVPFRVRFPKSPGRNPDFAFMLSIFGRQVQGSYPNGSGTSSRSRCCCNVSSHGKTQKAQERRVVLQDDKELWQKRTIVRREIREKCKGVAQKDSSLDEALVSQ